MLEQVTLSQAEVETTVIDAVARSLLLKPSEIAVNASLQDAYGAESLDMLEIAFSLERAFRIRLPHENILRGAEEQLGEGIFVRQGILTEQGLQILRRLRPEIDASLFTGTVRVHELGRLMTVQTFVRLALRLLEAKEEALVALRAAGCAKCGSHAIFASQKAAEFVCQDCSAAYPVPNGDAVLVEDVSEIYRENGRP
ncbi:MAG TPA: acyl carrier protein [Acidobacteriaceae bacterium]|nr:acyl carrier protein [Acidobacteriaceae bacterium]